MNTEALDRHEVLIIRPVGRMSADAAAFREAVDTALEAAIQPPKVLFNLEHLTRMDSMRGATSVACSC